MRRLSYENLKHNHVFRIDSSAALIRSRTRAIAGPSLCSVALALAVTLAVTNTGAFSSVAARCRGNFDYGACQWRKRGLAFQCQGKLSDLSVTTSDLHRVLVG